MKEKIRKLFTNVWTIPNVLTMIRLILIPVFVVLFFSGLRKAALAVFVAASLTDMLDGYLARKLNQITDFGKLFDPLADKLMVLTAMVCQAIAGVFPWAAVIIVACAGVWAEAFCSECCLGCLRTARIGIAWKSMQGENCNG